MAYQNKVDLTKLNLLGEWRQKPGVVASLEDYKKGTRLKASYKFDDLLALNHHHVHVLKPNLVDIDHNLAVICDIHDRLRAFFENKMPDTLIWQMSPSYADLRSPKSTDTKNKSAWLDEQKAFWFSVWVSYPVNTFLTSNRNWNQVSRKNSLESKDSNPKKRLFDAEER